MIVLIPAYLIFSLIVIIRQRKTMRLLWFLLMPLGFSLALTGLLYYTEYISFANFISNPIARGKTDYLWKLNYFLDLSIFDMYRMMNIGIALYLLGAIGFPLSHHSRKRFFRIGMIPVAILSVIILLDDPYLLLRLFPQDSFFGGPQPEISLFSRLNRILNFLMKSCLVISLLLAIWIYVQMPRIMRSRSKLIILAMTPIHALVYLLFFWFPGHTIQIWRLSTLKLINLPYEGIISTLIVILSFSSLAVLAYTSFVYNSLEMNVRKKQLGFSNRMSTAGSGIRVFTHSIKNQFVAVRLLAEQERRDRGNAEYLDSIVGICTNSIERLGAMPTLLDRIKLNYKRISLEELGRMIQHELPDVQWEDQSRDMVINVDSAYLMEVLRNLVANARDAVRNIPNPSITVCSRKKLDYLVLSVEDNGCGISSEDIKHIFEPFYSTKPSISNWGMGLAFSQQLIEAFGGIINVESEIDEYTRFEIYIPEDRDG